MRESEMERKTSFFVFSPSPIGAPDTGVATHVPRTETAGNNATCQTSMPDSMGIALYPPQLPTALILPDKQTYAADIRSEEYHGHQPHLSHLSYLGAPRVGSRAGRIKQQVSHETKDTRSKHTRHHPHLTMRTLAIAGMFCTRQQWLSIIEPAELSRKCHRPPAVYTAVRLYMDANIAISLPNTVVRHAEGDAPTPRAHTNKY